MSLPISDCRLPIYCWFSKLPFFNWQSEIGNKTPQSRKNLPRLELALLIFFVYARSQLFANARPDCSGPLLRATRAKTIAA
jgi:hypothetical protein